MTQVQNKPQGLDTPRVSGRSPLTKVATYALIGTALAWGVQLVSYYLTTTHFVIQVLILALVMLVAAGLTCLPLRWAPGIGVVVALLTTASNFIAPPPHYYLLHPAEAATFIPEIIVVAAGLLSIGLGIAATVQNYRRPAAPLPGNLGLLLTSFSAFVVGMIAVSLILAANPPSSAASTTTNGKPTVHLSPSNFVQNVVLVPKGSTLRLVGDSNNKHVLRNGLWTAAGSPANTVESGAPAVSDVRITSGSLDLGPYATAGIYHLYCTIHPQMNLTVVVQ